MTLYHPFLKANHDYGIPYCYRAKPLKFWHNWLTVAGKLHWLRQRIRGSGSASVRVLRGYQQIAVVILRRVHPGEVGLQCVRALWFGCQGWLSQSLSLSALQQNSPKMNFSETSGRLTSLLVMWLFTKKSLFFCEKVSSAVCYYFIVSFWWDSTVLKLEVIGRGVEGCTQMTQHSPVHCTL